MGFTPVKYKGKTLSVYKPITHPRIDEKTVLVSDPWEYVDLWLMRHKKGLSRFYWQQARSFYDAARALPNTCSPLPAYYSFLNATKALLIANGHIFADRHGVTGWTVPGRTCLSNEKVRFKTGGVLPALSSHLGESQQEEDFSMGQLLYNLPYVHRAYDLTYTSSKELFIPISHPIIVRSTKTHEAWFVAELPGKYATKATVNKLPSEFERELADPDRFLIRRTKRFQWRPADKTNSVNRYRNYHKLLRKHLFYIDGPSRLWYIKRGGNVPDSIPRSSMTLTFAAMHKLSELSRYTPEKLASHFACQHNWLLSEFIDIAPAQFIDEIAAEITGMEFMTRGVASRP